MLLLSPWEILNHTAYSGVGYVGANEGDVSEHGLLLGLTHINRFV